jgi:nucleotide-binding universal stress UspA family protein
MDCISEGVRNIVAIATKTTISLSIENIIVPFDFSKSSELALNYALVIARRYYSTIHLVHVIPLSQWPQPYDVTPPGPATEAVEEQRRIARQRLQSIAQRFANIPNHVWVEQGYPAEVVDVLAQAEHADLIVIGTHGFSGFKKFELGSVAEQIFRKTLCPVLTVGPHVRQVASDTVLRRILYPTDLLSGSYRGLSYALLLAADENAELTLLHVLRCTRPLVSNEAEWLAMPYEKRLASLIPRGASLSHEPVLQVEFGESPADVIIRVANEMPAELIVLDVRTAESWSAHLPDQAYRVVSEAPCPVLTVRHPH